MTGHRLCAALAGALLALAPAVALGQTVSASPRAIRITLGRAAPSSVTVRWLFTGASGSISSDEGQIQTSEAVPQIVALLPPLSFPATTVFVETIPLPVATIQALAESGIRELLILREFDNASVIRTAVVPIQIVSPLGGDFQVTRVQLRFPEGTPLRLVSRGSHLEAWADVSYEGTGEVQAIWEVADPASTSGAPVFRPLRRVRRQLTGGQRVSLRTPVLPTDQTGLHLVRLRLLAPGESFDEDPVLRYYVAEEDVPGDPVAIAVSGPPHEATLEPGTVFRWSPVPGARAYRLEIYPAPPIPPGPHFRLDPEHPAYADVHAPDSRQKAYEGATLPGDDPPLPGRAFTPPPFEANAVTGVLVAADRTHTELGQSRRHLEKGRTYVWIVRALGEGGVPIGLSPTRVIRVPD